jgi:hypothetical protein
MAAKCGRRKRDEVAALISFEETLKDRNRIAIVERITVSDDAAVKITSE